MSVPGSTAWIDLALPLICSIAAGIAAYVLASTRLFNHRPSSVRSWLARSSGRLVHGMVLAYACVFSFLMVLKHQTMHTSYDFAIFDQVVWNSLNGRLLATSITPLADNWLGTHFAPILLAFVPLYAVWDDPRALLIFQTLAIAFAALPLYWLARESIGRLLAFALVAAFLLFPSVQYVNLNEFHEIALAMPLFSLATFFLVRRRYLPLAVCLAVSLLLREEVALIVIWIGIALALAGRRKLGIGVALSGIIAAILVFQFVVPHFSFTKSFEVTRFHYASLGNTPSEVIISVLRRPDILLQPLQDPGRVRFVFQLLAPLGFLPLVGFEVTVLALPTLVYLLNAGQEQASILFQYPAPMIAFLFFGAALGLRRLTAWLVRHFGLKFERVQVALATMLIVSSVTTYYVSAPGPLARYFDPDLYSGDSTRLAQARELMHKIPAQSAVMTTDGAAPQLSHRRRLYYAPFYYDFRQVDYIFFDLTVADSENRLAPLRSSGYFQPISEENGFYLAQRRTPDNAAKLTFGGVISLLGYTLIPTETLRGGQMWRPILEWKAQQLIGERYTFGLQLSDARGHIWSEAEVEPRDGALATDAWVPGESIGDQYSLALPSTMPPGDYALSVSVCSVAGAKCLKAEDQSGGNLGEIAHVGTVHVDKDTSSITASQLQDRFQLEQPFYVDMAELRLIGFKSLPDVRPGDTIPIGLYWRARQPPSADYSVSVRLIDGQGRTVAAQISKPAYGDYPTAQWKAGEVLLDWHDLPLPDVIANGPYTIKVTLIHPTGSEIGTATLPNVVLVNR